MTRQTHGESERGERGGGIFPKWLIASYIIEAAVELCKALILIPGLAITAVRGMERKGVRVKRRGDKRGK